MTFAAVIAWRALGQLKIGLATLSLTEQQLKVSKEEIQLLQEDIKLRSRREAATLAAELCTRYASEVVPLADTLMKKLGSPPAVKASHDFLQSESSQCQPWLVEAWGNHEQELIALLNSLEGIAIYFDKELAEMDVAFPSVGQPFCDLCERFWPAIATYRPDHGNKLYCSIVAVYKIWKPKILLDEATLAAQRAQSTMANIGALQTKRPMGTS